MNDVLRRAGELTPARTGPSTPALRRRARKRSCAGSTARGRRCGDSRTSRSTLHRPSDWRVQPTSKSRPTRSPSCWSSAQAGAGATMLDAEPTALRRHTTATRSRCCRCGWRPIGGAEEAAGPGLPRRRPHVTHFDRRLDPGGGRSRRRPTGRTPGEQAWQRLLDRLRPARAAWAARASTPRRRADRRSAAPTAAAPDARWTMPISAGASSASSTATVVVDKPGRPIPDPLPLGLLRDEESPGRARRLVRRRRCVAGMAIDLDLPAGGSPRRAASSSGCARSPPRAGATGCATSCSATRSAAASASSPRARRPTTPPSSPVRLVLGAAIPAARATDPGGRAAAGGRAAGARRSACRTPGFLRRLLGRRRTPRRPSSRRSPCSPGRRWGRGSPRRRDPLGPRTTRPTADRLDPAVAGRPRPPRRHTSAAAGRCRRSGSATSPTACCP